MANKAQEPRKVETSKRMSAKAIRAAKAFKGLKAARTPAKLRGKRAAEIERAVRRYYLG